MAKKKKRPSTHDLADDFLIEVPTDRKGSLKDPEDDLDGWDLCQDFLDPLAHELEKWLRKPGRTAADIADLEWFDVGIDGLSGRRSCCNAWARAQTDLDPARRQFLKERVRGLAEEARRRSKRLGSLSKKKKADWGWVEVQCFEVEVVEPCLRDIRNLARAIEREQSPSGRKPRKRRLGRGKGKGGRPGLPEGEIQRREAILESWRRAREAGVPQKKFCRDEGIPLKELGAIVNWASTRQRRAKSS